MTPEEIIQIIIAVPASLGFAVIFNIRGRKLAAVALGGGLSWIIYVLLSYTGIDVALNYFLVATLISLYAETMARLLKAPATIFIAPSLVPLIPGASLYYAMSHALGGSPELFAEKALHTLKLAATLALGIIVSAVIMKAVTKRILIPMEKAKVNEKEDTK